MWENFQHEFQRYFVDNGASDWWLNGLKTTILVTLLALCIGVILGFLVALIRSTHEQTGKLKLLNAVCVVYLTVIRGTPSMIQILIFYSVVFASIPLNNIIIGGIAFGINSGAYVAEIVRSGIMSIDKGQMEAGRSLGLSSGQTMKLIIMPQAFKKNCHYRIYRHGRYHKGGHTGTEPYLQRFRTPDLSGSLLSGTGHAADLFHGQGRKEAAQK